MQHTKTSTVDLPAHHHGRNRPNGGCWLNSVSKIKDVECSGKGYTSIAPFSLFLIIFSSKLAACLSHLHYCTHSLLLYIYLLSLYWASSTNLLFAVVAREELV